MTERVRWRAKHDALAMELQQAQQELGKVQLELERVRVQLDEAEQSEEDLKKLVERARLQGMHDVTTLLLRGGQ